MTRRRIFISSVQKELAPEREGLRDYLLADPLLRRFFDVFLFEDLPAADRPAERVYLDEVRQCDIYLGLFANEYGWENPQGLSPTELEFNAATNAGKPRFISVKGANDRDKHPKMKALIARAGNELIRRCRQAGLPKPDFGIRAGFVVAIRRNVSPDHRLKRASSGKSSVICSVICSGKRVGKPARAIPDWVRKRPAITIPELAKTLGKTERAIEKQIRQLRDDEILARVGPAHGGHWEILE